MCVGVWDTRLRDDIIPQNKTKMHKIQISKNFEFYLFIYLFCTGIWFVLRRTRISNKYFSSLRVIATKGNCISFFAACFRFCALGFEVPNPSILKIYPLWLVRLYVEFFCGFFFFFFVVPDFGIWMIHEFTKMWPWNLHGYVLEQRLA